jgi:hypothetical protein
MRPASLEYQSPEVSFALAYLVLAWNPIYHLYDRPEEVFREDQVANVLNLFDGHHEQDEVVNGLPARLDDLFQPAFMDVLRNPSGPMQAGMRDNDRTCSWKPGVPVRLFGARADAAVPFAATESCAARLTEHGAEVLVTDVGDVDHMRSRVLATPRVLEWFNRRP